MEESADVVTARRPRQVAEAATGFKKESGYLGPGSHPSQRAGKGAGWHGTKSIVWCLYLEKWFFKPLRPDCSLDSS